MLHAQNIPEHIAYTQVYGFLDELATDGVVDLSSHVKPYSRKLIAAKLQEALLKDSLLSARQYVDLKFYLNDYSNELDTLPKSFVHWTNHQTFDLSLLEPSFHYRDNYFKCRIAPLLGMDLTYNRKGLLIKRWYGADIQLDIVGHVSVWGSIRDQSYNGKYLKDSYFDNNLAKINGAKLAQSQYLNNLPGCEYKEASYGGDFSDVRAGISIYDWWGSIGLVKDNVVWGDSYRSSNVLSGRAPSFPMVTLSLTPCKWFSFQYFHGWLNSNVADSTRYYVEESYTDSTSRIHYRPKNKFMAANLFTFTPIKNLNLSIGNSIVYAEDNVQAAYFIPFAFYKSLDHLMTKGLKVENQNSQAFLMVSSRNIPHLHLYGSVFVDEFSLRRWKKDNPERNIVSYQAGANVTNWPLKNLSYGFEYTRSNILCYKHSIEAITWESNSYLLGHYLGANSQEFYAHVTYKPIRSLSIRLSYVHADKGTDYPYVRRSTTQALSQPVLGNIIWKHDEASVRVTYEIWNNLYAVVDLGYNHDRAYDDDYGTAETYLNRYTPVYLHGENFTTTAGMAFGF